MLNLDTTTALVRLVTSGTADIDVNASYVDFTAPDTFTADGQNTLITTATTTTVVASPGASIKRNIKGLNIRNAHASSANTVTVEHTDGTTAVELFKVTLAAGEVLILNDAGVWFVYDATGGVKMGASAASDTLPGLIQIALQSDQETATSTILAVTPGRQHFHPSAAKFWCKAGVTGNNLASYNVTSIGDTGTGAMTVTIATDFSSANWCGVLSIENLDASIDAAADGQICMLGLAGQAAGTYAAINKNEAGTASADPTTWHVIGFGDQ